MLTGEFEALLHYVAARRFNGSQSSQKPLLPVTLILYALLIRFIIAHHILTSFEGLLIQRPGSFQLRDKVSNASFEQLLFFFVPARLSAAAHP